MTAPYQTTDPYIDNIMSIAGLEPPTTSYGIPSANVDVANTIMMGGGGTETGETEIPQTTQTPTKSYNELPSTLVPITPIESGGQQYSINLAEINPQNRGIYQSLFSPIDIPLKESGQSLLDAINSFLKEAGPRRTWESVGGHGILESAIAGIGDTTAGTNLVKTKYEGPQYLNTNIINTLTPTIQELIARKKSFYQPGGIEDLISKESPGLTPGELAFNAKYLRGQEGYGEAQRAVEQDIGTAIDNFLKAQQMAIGIGQQRASDEDLIAKNAQDYLMSQRSQMESLWDKAVEEAKARDIATQKAYMPWAETGNLADLANIPEYAKVTPWSSEQFNTESLRRAKEADTVWREIINNNYSDIKDVPLMGLSVTSKAREKKALPKEWIDANKKNYTDQQWNDLLARVEKRQKALEDAGFIAQTQGYKNVKVVPDVEVKSYATGKYSDIRPLYYASQAWTPENIANYVSWQDSVGIPTRETMSTRESRAAYNRIQDMLNAVGKSSGQIKEPQIAYQASRVLADIDGYLKAEQESLDKYKGTLTKNQRDWRKKVRHLRDKYEDAHNGFWNSLGNILEDFSFGLANFPPGYQIGNIASSFDVTNLSKGI